MNTLRLSTGEINMSFTRIRIYDSDLCKYSRKTGIREKLNAPRSCLILLQVKIITVVCHTIELLLDPYFSKKNLRIYYHHPNQFACTYQIPSYCQKAIEYENKFAFITPSVFILSFFITSAKLSVRSLGI